MSDEQQSTPTSGQTPEQPAPPAAPSPADIAQQPPPQPAPQGEKEPSGLPDDPAELKAEIARLRRENAASRTNAKTAAAQAARQELTQELAKALGLAAEEQAPDPDVLTAELAQQKQAADQARLELAVYRNATGADPARLLDSRSFLQTITNLDPGDNQAIKDAITAAVEQNPSFKTVQAAASTIDHPGGPGEKQVTAEQFAKMRPAQKAELFNTDPTLYRTLAGTI